jgi:hypothetical protein
MTKSKRGNIRRSGCDLLGTEVGEGGSEAEGSWVPDIDCAIEHDSFKSPDQKSLERVINSQQRLGSISSLTFAPVNQARS